MTATVYGQITDDFGAHFDRPNRTPAGNYRRQQPYEILVDLDHGNRPIGEVVYLERRHRHLCAVAVVGLEASDLDAYGTCWWSAATHATPVGGIDRDVELAGLAITKTPATVGLAPLRWLDGDLRDHRGGWGMIPELVEHAVAPALEHRWRCTAPLIIREPDVEQRRRLEHERALSTVRPSPTEDDHVWAYIAQQQNLDALYEQNNRPHAPIERRPGGRVLSVH